MSGGRAARRGWMAAAALGLLLLAGGPAAAAGGIRVILSEDADPACRRADPAPPAAPIQACAGRTAEGGCLVIINEGLPAPLFRLFLGRALAACLAPAPGARPEEHRPAAESSPMAGGAAPEARPFPAGGAPRHFAAAGRAFAGRGRA